MLKQINIRRGGGKYSQLNKRKSVFHYWLFTFYRLIVYFIKMQKHLLISI